MTRIRNAVCFAPVLLATLLCSRVARSSDDLEDQLRSNYQNKVLTLRHSYAGKHLRFGADGSSLDAAETGPWTVDGQIFVKQIKHHGSTLQIKGRRVCLVFDTKGKPYRDVLTLLSESNLKDRDKLQQYFRDNEVDLEIELSPGTADPRSVSSAMNGVFLAPEDSISQVVPDYWRPYFDRIEGRPPAEHAGDKPYTVTRGTAPPRVTYNPEPEYTDEARRAKYQGSITLSLVVDRSGEPKDLEITSPIGLGLDEKAVAAVGNWKFQPATKDGEPVSVKIAVEVDFHLY